MNNDDDFDTRLTVTKSEIENHRENVQDSIFRGPAVVDLLIALIENTREDPTHPPEYTLRILQDFLSTAETSPTKKVSSLNMSY
jgi:hypothetical protein